MNILSLNMSDLGGLSYNLCHAINKHTNHVARNVVNTRTFTYKPFMIRRTDSTDFQKLLDGWVRDADVLHFNERRRIIPRYNIKVGDCKGKKVIFHAHGSIFRKDPRGIMAQFREWFPETKFITSTPDLNQYASWGATWFPSVVPVTEYRKLYKRKKNTPPTIYYSPTGSSTAVMRSVIHDVSKELEGEGVKFKLQITRNTLHSKNMRMKAEADIYYDEIDPSPFYGVNAIEAGALEMPVICNMTPYARQYMERLFGRDGIKCPFLVVETREALKHTLRDLILDENRQIELGRAGLKYVRKMHSEKICVKRFMELVES